MYWYSACYSIERVVPPCSQPIDDQFSVQLVELLCQSFEWYVSTLSETDHSLHAVPSTISNVTERFAIPRQTSYQVSILTFLATSVGIGHCCLGLFSSRYFNPLLDGSTRDWPVKRIIPGKKIWIWCSSFVLITYWVKKSILSCCSAFFKWLLFDSMIIHHCDLRLKFFVEIIEIFFLFLGIKEKEIQKLWWN